MAASPSPRKAKGHGGARATGRLWSLCQNLLQPQYRDSTTPPKEKVAAVKKHALTDPLADILGDATRFRGCTGLGGGGVKGTRFPHAWSDASANEAPEKRSKSHRASRPAAQGRLALDSPVSFLAFYSLAPAALYRRLPGTAPPGWSGVPAGGHGGSASGLRCAFVGPGGSLGKAGKKKKIKKKGGREGRNEFLTEG